MTVLHSPRSQASSQLIRISSKARYLFYDLIRVVYYFCLVVYYSLFNFFYTLLCWYCFVPKAFKYILLMFYNFFDITVYNVRGWFSFVMKSCRCYVFVFTNIKITFDSVYMPQLVYINCIY